MHHDEMAELGGLRETSPRAFGLGEMIQRVADILKEESKPIVDRAKDAAVSAQLKLKDEAIASLSEQINNLRDQLKAAAEKAPIAKDVIQNLELDSSRELEELKASFQKRIAELRSGEAAKIEELTTKLAAANASVQKLQAALAAADIPSEQKALLAAQTQEIEKLKNLLATATKEKETLEARAAKLDADARAHLLKITTLEDEQSKAAAQAAANAASKDADHAKELARVRAEFSAECDARIKKLEEEREITAKPIEKPVQEVIFTEEEVKPIVVPLKPKAHQCSSYAPSQLEPLWPAMRAVLAANPTLGAVQHFNKCRRGLAAHMKRESGLRWTLPPTKERPRTGSTIPRFSYGIIQLLDDTAHSLVKYRGLLGDEKVRIKDIQTASPTGEPRAATQRELGSSDRGPWYVILYLARFGRWIGTHFKGMDFYKTGVLVPDTTNKDAKFVADYVNSFASKHPNVDPVSVLLRMYGGAGSLAGMRNNIKSGHTDRSLGFLVKFTNEFAADEGSAPLVA